MGVKGGARDVSLGVDFNFLWAYGSAKNGERPIFCGPAGPQKMERGQFFVGMRACGLFVSGIRSCDCAQPSLPQVQETPVEIPNLYSPMRLFFPSSVQAQQVSF